MDETSPLTPTSGKVRSSDYLFLFSVFFLFLFLLEKKVENDDELGRFNLEMRMFIFQCDF